MKKLLILASISALLAGCASRDTGGTGAGAYGGTEYGAGRRELDDSPGANQKGAGAADLTGTLPAGTAAAGGTGTATPGAAQMSATLTDADNQFMQRAAQDGKAEIRMGQVIVQKAQNQDLRNYGQRLINDHTRMDQQLAQIAARKTVLLPTQADAAHQQMMDTLTSLSGMDFDQSALQDAIRDHQTDIQLYQQASTTLQDPDLRAFAQQSLPILQQHLDLARQLRATLNASQGGVGQ
ncbi:MAG: outer membrane protein [Pedosphaera sp.]|nr:outer membrane protein [Pedosphaera sp.]